MKAISWQPFLLLYAAPRQRAERLHFFQSCHNIASAPCHSGTCAVLSYFVGNLVNEFFHFVHNALLKTKEKKWLAEYYLRKLRKEIGAEAFNAMSSAERMNRVYEMEAEDYRRFVKMQESIKGPLANLFNRFRNFVAQIADAIGLHTPYGLYLQVRSGKLYTRGVSKNSARKAAAQADAEAMQAQAGPEVLQVAEREDGTRQYSIAEDGTIDGKRTKDDIAATLAAANERAEKAAEEDSTAYFIKDIVDEIIWNPSPSGMDLEIRWKDKKIFKRNIKTRLKLLGQVQGENAALAALSCKIAYPEITEETIEKGLSKAWIPSRFEIVNTNPQVILDGAHTPLSISFSLETLNSLWPDKKVNLLFACAQDKKVEEISRILCPRCSKIFITKPGNTKPCNPERMVKAFKESLLEKFSEDHQKVNETLDMDLDFVNSINRALKTSEKENRILLVTGSFYLTAEVKKIISGEKN